MSATPNIIRVLGIDPGLASTGWGAIKWDVSKRKAVLIDYGVVETPAGAPLARRLETIYTGLTAVIERIKPSVAAVEQLYFARNVQTAMAVAHGRGAAILATARRNLELIELSPPQIKQALTGHGRASKEQIQLMVRALLELKTIPRPDHAADALAAALCHVQMRGLNEQIAQATPRASGAEDDPRKMLLARSRRRRRR